MNPDDLNNIMAQLFMQAHAQFGDAIKDTWPYDNADNCAGCQRKVSAMDFKGQKSLSFNAYIYRDRGVLIGYMLCGRCAKIIHRASKNKVKAPLGLHHEIEATLEQAYDAYRNSADA